MPTFAQYVRDVLEQVQSSCEVFESLDDKPGDLETMKREWIKVDRLLHSLSERLSSSDVAGDTYQKILKKCKYYTQNYSFDREIEIMADLYSSDPHRLKNIRLKILESFYDKKFIQEIRDLTSKLGDA